MDRRTFNKLAGLTGIGALTKVVDANAEPLVKEENMPPDASRTGAGR
jgi:hypothetical protein